MYIHKFRPIHYLENAQQFVTGDGGNQVSINPM